MSSQDPAKLARRLSKVKHILLVLSGKGGVGKSSMSVQLALSLLDAPRRAATSSSSSPGDDDSSSSSSTPQPRQPRRIGLLDIDLTGPSIPRMLGLDGASVHQSDDGWVPVYLPLTQQQQTEGQELAEEGSAGAPALAGRAPSSTTTAAKEEFKVMSIGFLLKDSRQAVVWRGPKKSAMIRQFLADVRWGELDWLVIDTPPGTSDEHISLLENLLPALQSSPNTTLHSVLVTTPQAVSLSDVSKELSFTRRTGLPVIGLIENMSGYICPHCSVIHNIFGKGGGEEFCRLETEKAIREGRPETERLRFLGRVPVDSEFVKVVDAPKHGQHLLQRYKATQSSKLLADICAQVVRLVEESSSSASPSSSSTISHPTEQ